MAAGVCLRGLFLSVDLSWNLTFWWAIFIPYLSLFQAKELRGIYSVAIPKITEEGWVTTRRRTTPLSDDMSLLTSSSILKMRLLGVIYGLGFLLSPLTAAQSVVFIIYTTTSLNYCPCTGIFPSVTRCANCQTWSTTLVSTATSGPSPTGDGFTVDLTVGLGTGYERVTLSRVSEELSLHSTCPIRVC